MDFKLEIKADKIKAMSTIAMLAGNILKQKVPFLTDFRSYQLRFRNLFMMCQLLLLGSDK